ncbi:MAG: response regulator [Planctomycetes bacterium]|nr:response regulator [Planctomycetota bacterium]
MAEKILFLEDETKIRDALKSYFAKRTPYELYTAESGEAAVALAKETPIDLIVADVVMPGKDGIEAIQEIQQFNPGIACIVITGFAEENAPIRALKLGVRDYIKKPFDPAELLNSAENLLKLRRLEREAEEMRKSLEVFRSQLEETLGIIRSTARISSNAEPAALMESILRLAVDMTGAGSGAIFLLNDDGKSLTFAGGMGGEAGDESLPLGEGIAGKVANTGQPICGSGEMGQQGAGVERNRQSVLAVALETEGDRVGVIEVFDKPGGGFDKRDLSVLISLARLGGIAIADNRIGARVKDLLLDALRRAVGGEVEAEVGAADKAIESLRASMEKVDLSGGQERALHIAELVADIGQHGARELEFCEKMLTEFHRLLQSRGLGELVEGCGLSERE